MLAVLALEKTPPEGIEVTALASSGLYAHTRNKATVWRFLCGRQFLVVILDFVFHRLTGFYGALCGCVPAVVPRRSNAVSVS